MILLKRAYEPASPADGKRFLVERLWPRGREEDIPPAQWLVEGGRPQCGTAPMVQP